MAYGNHNGQVELPGSLKAPDFAVLNSQDNYGEEHTELWNPKLLIVNFSCKQ